MDVPVDPADVIALSDIIDLVLSVEPPLSPPRRARLMELLTSMYPDTEYYSVSS